MEEVAADSPGASVAADLAAGEHGGPRQAAFAMAGKAGTKLELCFTKVDWRTGLYQDGACTCMHAAYTLARGAYRL